MKVSIIIPVYNVELYLEECLNSAMNQTLKEIEIICVNDGSTDSSLQILNMYEDKYGNLKIINQENKGLSGARNAGIRAAKGKYIYFLDSDDYITLDTIEICYNEAEKNNLDILTFDAECFMDTNYSGNIIHENYDRSKLLESKLYTGKEFYLTSNNKGAYRSPVWLYFYNSKFILENSLYFIEGILHEDEVYTVNALLLAEKVKYIPNKFFNRRFRNNSIMTSNLSEQRVYGNFSVANEVYKLYNQENLDNRIKYILLQWIRLYYSNCLRICYALNLLDIREKVIEDINKKKDVIDINLEIQINKYTLINSSNLYYNTNEMLKNLFIVHTPYHIVLATAIANNKMDKYNNEIFINNTFDIKKDEIIKLKTIFRNVYILNDKSNLDEINNMLQNNKYINIFVNNETEIHTQYILQTRLDLNGSINYIEDGACCYFDLNKNIKMGIGKNNVEYYSELLNIKLEDVDVLGTYSKITKRYFIYPNYIKKCLNDGKPNLEIKRNLLIDSIKILYDNLGFEIDTNEKSIIILLEHSDFFKVNSEYNFKVYIELLNKLINILVSKNNMKVYLKYHPRESGDYNNLFATNNINYIDKRIPIEAFYKFENLYIVSLKSTSLMTAYKIINKNRVISIDRILNNKSDELTKKLEEIGIQLPKTIDDILDIII